MNRVIRITAILFFSTILNSEAQLVKDLYRIYEPLYNANRQADSSRLFTPFGVVVPGVNYGLTIGSGYTFMGSGAGISQSYLSPSISYSGDRLQVVAGVTLTRSNMHGMNASASGIVGNGPQTSNPYQAWALTQYQFTNRLSIYAVGAVSQNQTHFSPYQNRFGTYNSQQFGVGFNYSIGKNTSIGASINFVKGNSFSPWGGSFSPFGW